MLLARHSGSRISVIVISGVVGFMSDRIEAMLGNRILHEEYLHKLLPWA